MTSRDEKEQPVTDDLDDYIQEVPSHTPDFKTQLAEELARLAPEAIADGKVDVEKLRELLSDDAANDGRERFGLMWQGKSRALKAAQAQTTATLVPDREASKDWDTTKNVFIEGDNLEVLKILGKHYHGKVKLIYIDPPYNTGNDFVYPDNFKEGLKTYLEWTQQVTEEGKKRSSNTESDGRYHSNWLNMIYPRLKLAHNLLAEDGVIFISIDDNEIENLLRVGREIFGESNHLVTFIWKSKSGGANDSGDVAVDHEYVVGFRRNAQVTVLGLDAGAIATTSYNKEDDLGLYSLERLDKQNLGYSESLDFPITGPDGTTYRVHHKDRTSPKARWRWSQESVGKRYEELVFKDGFVYTKNYQKEGGKPRSLLVDERFGRSRTGSTEALRLLGGSYFDNPKPSKLVKYLIGIGTHKDSLVLDFFAGSATTGHAVMALNAEDGGNRRHIQVQLPEPIGIESDAGRAGFSTIADIARERIRRAGAKIKEEVSDQLSAREIPLDFGFRSYKLSDTSFVKWRETSEAELSDLAQRLAGLRGSADDDASPEALLTELLVKQGYSLSEQITQVEVKGLQLWSVAEGALLAIMDEHVKPSLEQLRAVVEAGAVRLVVLEDVFAGDDQLKTNLVQHAKTHGVELWTA
jgi:adenine-specific DNA-methyltransferase